MLDLTTAGKAAGEYNKTANNENNQLQVNPFIKNKVEETNTTGVKQKKPKKTEECETCKNRKYQDGSSDPGVSFKSPTKLSPQQASTAVYAHEREHYTREDAKAKQEGKEVISNTIAVFTSVCPECGKTYVSGGETRTVTRTKAEDDKLDFAKKFFDNTVGKHIAREFDAKA